MYLKEIVANGFKSFADRTRLSLGKGMTAVVGPNGCGKSNIVDAIRWVLGEQSAKSLRGTSMQDVIFAGSDQRKALPQCEVELVFADCEKELGTQFAEVSVMRRLYREGASDYFINGKPCRLKDIQRLFMDTGVGRMSYSFMVQGQIDQILSANPAERRYLFEEAAGITRYKAQRKEALNKLTLVEQNLARTTDVIEEVARQIGSLKRQAAKALRYRRLRHRLTHLDLAWQGNQWGSRRARVVELEGTSQATRAEAESLTAALAGREAALAEAKLARAEAAERIERAQHVLYEIRASREAAESEVRTSELRAEDILARSGEIRREVAECDVALSEIETRLSGGAQERSAREGEVTQFDASFRERSTEVEQSIRAVAAAEVGLRQARQDLLMAEGEITRHRADVTNLEVDLRSFQARRSALSDSLYQARDVRSTAERRATESATVVTRLHTELEAARAAEQQTEAEGRRLTGDFRALQQTITEQDRAVAKRSAQLGLLEQMQSRLEGFSEGAKAVLRGELSDSVPAGKAAALSTLLDIADATIAPALENLLGAATEAVALDDAEFLPRVVTRLSERNLGRAVFHVPTPPIKPSSGAPAWLRPASTAVSPRSPAAARLLESLFSGCYLCPSLPEFLTWWSQNPSFEFYLVATNAGDLVDRRGLVFAGPRASTEETGRGVFSRDAEIRETRARLTEENDHLTVLNERAMALQTALEGNEAERTSRRQAFENAAQEHSVAQADERAARAALVSADERISREQQQLTELEAAQAEASERLDFAKGALSGKEQEIESFRTRITEGDRTLESARAAAEALRQSLGEVRLSLAERRQLLELAGRAVSELEQRREETRLRREARLREAAQSDGQVASLRATADTSRVGAAELTARINDAAAILETDRAAQATREASLETDERELTSGRDARRDAESRLRVLEVSLAEESSQCGFISEKVMAEHQLDISSVDWRQQLWLADEPFEPSAGLGELEDEEEGSEEETAAMPRAVRGEPSEKDLAALDNTDWPPLVREIAALRERLAGMGAVNLVAVEEYASLRQRHDFLKTQSDDLWKSKEELIKAIDEINETSLKLFTDTFEQVRKNFAFTFERLFNGGKADLHMVQAEDVLDSGIEIIAQPPGTKLRGISLLSGGQRTMTAVALLFAIYMVKPSPFCVLDELDAPLDDVNVGRFTDIVREFTRHSQFLVITHKKGTVAAADAIFGVTMQEKGVTRVYSMRFNRERNEAEATSPQGR
jgi:chromosome segregation protein